MNTHQDPRDVAIALVKRSDLRSFHLGAVIFDNHGIFGWGWNHIIIRTADFLKTICAERHAIFGANRRRLVGATMIVAGRKKHNGLLFLSRPCEICFPIIVKVGIRKVIYSKADGSWGEDRIY